MGHATLIQQEAWTSCLQCHDFHGNHLFDVPARMADTIPLRAILEYAEGGPDPYSTTKKHPAKTDAR